MSRWVQGSLGRIRGFILSYAINKQQFRAKFNQNRKWRRKLYNYKKKLDAQAKSDACADKKPINFPFNLPLSIQIRPFIDKFWHVFKHHYQETQDKDWKVSNIWSWLNIIFPNTTLKNGTIYLANIVTKFYVSVKLTDK